MLENFWYNNNMNDKELEKIAKQLALLELIAKEQKISREDEKLQNTLNEMNNIMESLSLEDLFKLDSYIQQELKCY